MTRDAVLGRLAGETPPDVVVCVADATNLRLVLRLILELKAVGRPMVLALNMYDIAQRQGLRIGKTDVLDRHAHNASAEIQRVRTAIQHAHQPVERSIGVRAAHGLVQR